MNELLAFIKQLLPPNWKGAKTVGLVQVLFAPGLTVRLLIDQARQSLIGRAAGTGQVAALEDVLTRALKSTVYIVDGDRSTTDFQVIVETGQLDKLRSIAAPLLRRYAQAGKRYTLAEAPVYATVIDTAPGPALAWTAGFPQRATTQLKWAVNKAGNYVTVIKKNGVEVLRETRSYQAGVEQNYTIADVATDVYVLQVDSLSATLAGSGILELWAVKAGTDALSLLLDAAPGGAFIWVLDTLNGQGGVTASQTNSFTYSQAGYPNPGISPTLFHYGGLALGLGNANGNYRLRVVGGPAGATASLLYDQNFSITDANPNHNFVAGPPPDTTGSIDAFTVDTSAGAHYAFIRASGPAAAGGVEFKLTGPNGLLQDWSPLAAQASTQNGVAYTHLTALGGLLDTVGTYSLQARLTINHDVTRTFGFVVGTTPPPPPPPPATSAVVMQQIRFQLRGAASQVDIGITADGDWEYQVARTGAGTQNGQPVDQTIPDWNSIPWTDAPAGSAATERVLTMPAHNADKTLQARIRNKANLAELYEVPVKCTFGNNNGFGWLILSKPAAGLLSSAFQVLPGRTWSDDLAITAEAGPDANSINVRFVSGIPLAANTRWFWWLGGVPLYDKADNGNFTVTVAKGLVLDIARLICPSTFEYYNDQGQVYATEPARQTTGTYYTNSQQLGKQLLDTDSVRFWTGL